MVFLVENPSRDFPIQILLPLSSGMLIIFGWWTAWETHVLLANIPMFIHNQNYPIIFLFYVLYCVFDLGTVAIHLSNLQTCNTYPPVIKHGNGRYTIYYGSTTISGCPYFGPRSSHYLSVSSNVASWKFHVNGGLEKGRSINGGFLSHRATPKSSILLDFLTRKTIQLLGYWVPVVSLCFSDGFP